MQAAYFKINIFNITSFSPLKTPCIGCSGLYKVGDKTPEQAILDVIVPRNGFTQVAYFDENLNKIEHETTPNS